MGDEKDRFVVTLNLNREDDDNGCVYYKQDGQRFNSSCTIKMNIETHYAFTLTIRPQQVLESVSIKGDPVSLPTGIFKENASIYNFQWFSSGFVVTKKTLREAIPLDIKVKDRGVLTIMLQAKFYKSGDLGHSTWGTPLHHIDYECQIEADKLAIDIMKEVFR